MASHTKVDAPDELALGSGQTRTRIVRNPSLYAIHDWDEENNDKRPVLVLDGAAVFRGSSSGKGSVREGPVYESLPGGTPAVPTGRVFVRFSKSVDANSREAALNEAGYHIVQRLPWAPFSAWVEAKNGDVAESLRNLDKLRSIDDVENVEPQVLMPAATRV